MATGQGVLAKHEKEYPMALGVLNNLSAIYAENNLNNTSNSLQTVLQQLSSGSKINSGADDAAGLSLVNGLQANSTALSQSETNATEGVGLLQVADGALSQVTNLLDRAITLATEASNGTLNTSQEAAANQEYSSIMSEVNNIGSTTTYNQQQVFTGNTVAIYTGDSSTVGSSIDDLNIRAVSSSSVGDTGGAMSYSSGQGNVFIDLSKGGINAAASDSLSTTGSVTNSTTITVNYLAKGASGSSTSATANITVGAGTNFANTAQGMINAINSSGLGLSASFGTAEEAGSVATAASTAGNTAGGSSSDTGIIISGTGVGTGTNGAGEIGTLTVVNSTDTLGGTLTVVGTDGKSHAITLGTPNSTDTIANLAATINAADYGVTATANTAIVNGHAAGTVLTFSADSAAITVAGTNVTDAPGSTATLTVPAYVALAASTGAGATVNTMTVADSRDILSGTLTLTGMDGTQLGGATTALGTAGSTDTLADLAATINAKSVSDPTFDLHAALSNNGTTLTVTNTVAVNAGATNVPVMSVVTPGASNFAAVDSLTGIPTIDTPYSAAVGTLTFGNTTGTLSGTLNIGSNAPISLGTPGETDTVADLLKTINNGSFGVKAALDITGKIMTFTSSNSAITFSGTGLGETGALGSLAATTAVADPNQIGTVSDANGWVVGTSNTDTMTAGGTIKINGVTVYTATAQTLDSVATSFNGLNLGITATMNDTTGIMSFESTTPATAGVSIATTIADPTLHNLVATTDTPSTTNSEYYSVGITGSILDTTTHGGTLTTGMVVDTNGTSGAATTSYTDGAGANLANTDLLSQPDAEAALTALSTAITDVASMDGYIGAQINTLNSVSQVMTTQQENVTSAQNAIQATDYAAATSAMSKYEILSQTGIAALAQANTVQQEVTKLLQ